MTKEADQDHSTLARVTERQLGKDDFEAVTALQLECFPGMKPWSRGQWDSMIDTFPEGQLAVEVEGGIAATASSLIVDYAEYAEWHDWRTIADDGHIQNHDPAGDTLYGIEIQVSPRFRGMKLARRLYEARKEICRERQLARIVIGGRIPGYAKHADALTPQQYVAKVMQKELHDMVLTAQIANGFTLLQLIPDYYPSDEDSGGFATCLEWPNLDFMPRAHPRSRRAHEPVRVATAQYQMRRIQNFEEFAKQVEFLVDVASDHKADFLCFPELFTLQLLSLITSARPGLAARELAEYTPQFIDLMQGLAIRYNVNIIGGSQFTNRDDRLLNICTLFRRDGSTAEQQKIHVTPNESRWWGVQGGNRVEVFDTDRGKIAILICYDVEFPELARVIAESGALLLFVPFNTNDRHGLVRVQTCARARAIENQIYVITSGCTGNLPFVENADLHYAQSGVYTPADLAFARDGIAAEAQPNLETVVIHDLDLEALRRARRNGTVRNWADRRLDLYRVEWKGEK